MDSDYPPIQFALAMTHSNVPLVVMILPDIVDPDTGEEGYIIPIGLVEDVQNFAASLLKVAGLVDKMTEDLGEDPDDETVREIAEKYAQILSAPYN